MKRAVRRRLEIRWRKINTEEDKQYYLDQKNKVNKLIDSEKSAFYQEKLSIIVIPREFFKL